MDVNTESLIDNGSLLFDATGYSIMETELGSGLSEDAEAAVDWFLTLTLVVKTFLMGLIIAASIFGNLLVIISVARFRKLRIITNYFVVSLAMADILVALVAMGFNASVIIFGQWIFSYAMCDIWNSFDVYCCTVSILHLCCISVDRYYAISQPLMYPMKITRKKVAVMLANIWTWPALISFFPIFLGWYTTDEHQLYREKNPHSCRFVVNKVYALISSSISFWIPCTIMLYTYYRIYEMASRQEKMLLKNADAALLFRQQNQRRSAEMEQHQIHHIQQQNQDGASITTAVGAAINGPNSGILPAIQVTKPDVLLEVNGKAQQQQQNGTPISSSPPPPPPENKRISAGDRSALLDSASDANRYQCRDETCSNTPTISKDSKHLQKIRREHKAARTLGIIMGAFVLCWLPFFIWYLSVTLCGDMCYCPDIVVEVLFWIGYFNSTLNPLIYAYFNKDFREAFRNTLVCVFCTRCQDPREQQRDQLAALGFHQQQQQHGKNNLGRLSVASAENQTSRTIRHSSGDTIAGIERIDHKRLSGVAVQNL